MPKQIFELFGRPLQDEFAEAMMLRHEAKCPFSNANCDGGGNRHQTTIALTSESKELQAFFPNLEQVIPGICSIQSENETWLVCPRRLFAVKDNNKVLLAHERAALEQMDFPAVPLGIWSEVNISTRDEDSSFNYHFDYVISPVTQMLLSDIKILFPDDPDLHKQLQNRSKNNMVLVPTLEPFSILEVMTASTSGSNKSKGTDISSVFKKAVLGLPHTAPGINKRQVWGRMATQLFAKSACAEQWGGKTFWLLQDQFLTEIEATTRLSIEQIQNTETTTQNNIHLIVFHVDDITGETITISRVSSSAGLPFLANNPSFTGILLPKKVPSRTELLKAMLRKAPLLEVRLSETVP
jgi:hypothetical protein